MHCHSCRYLAQLCCLAVRVRKRVRKCPKLVHPRVVAMADFASSVTLSPSEYRGDPNTCVAGRVVILRGPIELRPRVESNQPAAPANASKGKKGKGAKGAKGKKGDATEARIKTEVHVLGGDSAAEILFSDAWAENAKDLVKLIELGKVYRFAGAKYIAKPPEYSTSRLAYFLRFEGRFGTHIKIAECTDNPWADAPLFHPLADIANLSRVGNKMQTCIAGLLTHQPGLIDRDTKWGPGKVCNAVVKQGDHDIRFSFWRDAGVALSGINVGEVRAFLQVNIVQSGGSWECHATEATQIVACPTLIEAAIKGTTDQEAASTSLTKQVSLDYDKAPGKPITLSAVAGIIAPRGSREMLGVYELHNVAVLGVSAVLGDGGFRMECCKECFQRVDEGSSCSVHPIAGVAPRWIFSLELADGETSLPAMLYNDAASGLPFLSAIGNANEDIAKRRIIDTFRSAPWSCRLVLKPDMFKDTNYVEIKRIAQTLTVDGVVETYEHKKMPRARGWGRPGCPFTRCADVTFDKAFGVIRCNGVDATAVRVLVEIEAHQQDIDPDIATPDPTGQGLRVSRKVSCVLSPDDSVHYALVTSGTVGAVQWLLTALPGTVFFVTATATTVAATVEFRTLACMNVTPIGKVTFAAHMRQVLERAETVDVEFTPSRATPQSRKRSIDDAAGDWLMTNGSFANRKPSARPTAT